MGVTRKMHRYVLVLFLCFHSTLSTLSFMTRFWTRPNRRGSQSHRVGAPTAALLGQSMKVLAGSVQYYEYVLVEQMREVGRC